MANAEKQHIVKVFAGLDGCGKKKEREVVVPDGKWVLPASYYSFIEYEDGGGEISDCRDYSLIGPAPSERLICDRDHRDQSWDTGWSSSRSEHALLVGDQPFGAIFEEKRDGMRSGGLYFSCARQVHKGELGRRPQIARPKFAREAPLSTAEVSTLTEKPIPARDRRRGEIGWACVADVARLVNREPQRMMEEFFVFTHAENPALQVLADRAFAEVNGKRVALGSWWNVRESDLPDFFTVHNPSRMWIRKGFAMTILYLNHFGYRGEEKAPAAVV